jgi:beta-glucanase (GH16 family)
MWEFRKDAVLRWYYAEGDEFNGDKIDLNYWKYIGSVRSLFPNQEREYYTDGENHVVSGGTLKLTAKKDSVFKRTIDWMKDEDSLFNNKKFVALNKQWFEYTAGKLVSQRVYNKGYFECRFKLPAQKGYWPAFWLYGGSPNEEIDIMECKSERPSQIHLDTHCGDHCDYVNTFLKKESYGGWVNTKQDFSAGFNVVACSWTADEIRFYINGECAGVSKVRFDVAKNLVLNIAVPSDKGPFHPGPERTDSSTAIYEVDYVRVWTDTLQERPKNGQDVMTYVDTVQPLLKSSDIKTKKKVVYGKKKDHQDEGVFISYFQNVGSLQFTTLGNFKTDDRPVVIIRDLSGKELIKTRIVNQFTTINTQHIRKGGYDLIVDYGGNRVIERLAL